MNARTPDNAWSPPQAVTQDQALRWVAKSVDRSSGVLALAGPEADPAEVTAKVASRASDRAFGNFMLTWLDRSEPLRVIHYLPDPSFFLRLLYRTYRPFTPESTLHRLLGDHSRTEVSLTNDVLQIQLRDGDGDSYSMIRHHALMLFYATLWLEEPQRDAWLSLYDAAVSHVFDGPTAPPDSNELDSVEAKAFEGFRSLAAATLDSDQATKLLESAHELDAIIDYQLYAAAAIGLLWRQYRDLSPDQQQSWTQWQLTKGYPDPDYLREQWASNLMIDEKAN
jgi:hypothetical protein